MFDGITLPNPLRAFDTEEKITEGVVGEAYRRVSWLERLENKLISLIPAPQKPKKLSEEEIERRLNEDFFEGSEPGNIMTIRG